MKKYDKYTLYYISSLYLNKGLREIFLNKKIKKKVKSLLNVTSDKLLLDAVYNILGFKLPKTKIDKAIENISTQTNNSLYNIEEKIFNSTSAETNADFDSEVIAENYRQRHIVLKEIIRTSRENPINNQALESIFNLLSQFSGENQSSKEHKKAIEDALMILDKIYAPFIEEVSLASSPKNNISSVSFSGAFEYKFYLNSEDNLEEAKAYIKKYLSNILFVFQQGELLAKAVIDNTVLNILREFGSYQNTIYSLYELNQNKKLTEREKEVRDYIVSVLTSFELTRRTNHFKTINDLFSSHFTLGEAIMNDDFENEEFSKIITGNLNTETIEITYPTTSIITNDDYIDEILKFGELQSNDKGIACVGKTTLWKKIFKTSMPKDGNFNNIVNTNI